MQLTFAQEFARRLEDIEERAKKAGSNMTQVCKATRIARPTFERWVHGAPQSITKLDELAAEVSRLEQVAAAGAQTAAPSAEVAQPPVEQEAAPAAFYDVPAPADGAQADEF